VPARFSRRIITSACVVAWLPSRRWPCSWRCPCGRNMEVGMVGAGVMPVLAAATLAVLVAAMSPAALSAAAISRARPQGYRASTADADLLVLLASAPPGVLFYTMDFAALDLPPMASGIMVSATIATGMLAEVGATGIRGGVQLITTPGGGMKTIVSSTRTITGSTTSPIR